MSLVAETMETWTLEGFMGVYDAYYVAADTGQRFFVSLRLAVSRVAVDGAFG